MRVFIIILCISIITSLVAFLSITGKIIDKRKKFFKRLTFSGYLIAGCLIILIFLPAIQYYYTDQEEETNKKELSDANKKIIQLQEKTIDATEKLNNAYYEIKNLQGKTIDEITSGNAKPFLNISLGYKTEHSQGYGNYRFNDEKIDYYIVKFDIKNLSKYHFKNVRVKVQDRYGKIRTITQSDGKGGYGSISEEVIPNEVINDVNFWNRYDKTIELNILGSNSLEEAYKTKAPIGIGIYNYRVYVEWNSGSYYEDIQLQEVDSLLRIKRIDLYDENKKINDVISYFKMPIDDLSILTKCGVINYQNEKFRVYWYKKEGFILVCHEPLDLYGFNNYHDWKANNAKEALIQGQKMLEYAFGKEDLIK